jgi:hypothetical protein
MVAAIDTSVESREVEISTGSKAYGASLTKTRRKTGATTDLKLYYHRYVDDEGKSADANLCAIPRLPILPADEDRVRLTLARWEGGYRWFRAPNVICLEKARKLKAYGRI